MEMPEFGNDVWAVPGAVSEYLYLEGANLSAMSCFDRRQLFYFVYPWHGLNLLRVET